MKQIKLEIRASEGGNDSKLLVEDLTNIYVRACKNQAYN
jgi:protein subunit release factor A